MADLNTDTYERWWRETREYSWDSLRTGLSQIYRNKIIDVTMYKDLQRVVTKLEDLKIDFPLSPEELEERVNFYL